MQHRSGLSQGLPSRVGSLGVRSVAPMSSIQRPGLELQPGDGHSFDSGQVMWATRTDEEPENADEAGKCLDFVNPCQATHATLPWHGTGSFVKDGACFKDNAFDEGEAQL